MFAAFTNCFKIPELRQRIFLTLGLIFIARIGAGIPLPGVDPSPLQNFYASASSDGGGLAGLYNMFTGGAMVNGAIFALGIMPYISASIILQLMGAVMPSLARLMQEGDTGRQKIAQYTRYLTLLIGAIQGSMITYALVYSPGTFFSGFDTAQWGPIIIAGNIPIFFIVSVILMTAGCLILTWLGEQITQRGVGNGVSLIITVGIIDTLPGACTQAYHMVFDRAVGAESSSIGIPQAVLMLVFLLAVTAAIIMILQAVRKIPVQYAKRVVGRKLMGGQSSYLPLKVNYAGVMPIIFASALLLFPQQIFGQFNLSTYNLIYGSLVFAFSYFWVSIMFKPLQNLRRTQTQQRIYSRRSSRRTYGKIPRLRDDAFDVRGRIVPRHHRGIAEHFDVVLGYSAEDSVFLRRHGRAYRGRRISRHYASNRNVSFAAPL